MKIGVPKEIKTQEYRVGLTPESVMELTRGGLRCRCRKPMQVMGLVAPDAAYDEGRRENAGHRRRRCSDAEMIVKVKEPQPVECAMPQAAPHAVHLPPPRRRQTAGRSADEVGATCIARRR